MPDGSQAYAVDDPHFLGPVIAATKDKPVRIVFYNLLPTGAEGDLFLPVDSTIMGSGMGPIDMMDPVDLGTVMDEVRNPVCAEYPKSDECFKDNRATLHLHGGITPWISDGTPHQWITPANETTPWPQGVSVEEVPDMADVPGVPNCTAEDDGCQTFYYTNQQSARLMFYHDHAWGITRLNVYAGEAAGYLITDPTEQKLVSRGLIPSDQIPLIIQDRTFVPDAAQLAAQDPTWDSARWGGYGNLWYHHVYMPAQNPGDPGGMSAYGRWMYGPWFWPPATNALYGPIANPYYDPACNLDDPATWQYQTDPFCEPELIPGTPNISAGMEQFNDTPAGQRHGLPDHHGAAQVLPPAHPERGQRPLLEPAVVRGRPDDGHSERGSAQGQRTRGRTDRPGRLPDTRHRHQPRRAQLDPDRHRGRLPAGPGGGPQPAHHLDHRPDPLRRR